MINFLMRSTKTAVFPDPAAAATSMFFSLSSIALCCSLVQFIFALFSFVLLVFSIAI